MKLQMNSLASHLQFKIRVREILTLKIPGFMGQCFPFRDKAKRIKLFSLLAETANKQLH